MNDMFPAKAEGVWCYRFVSGPGSPHEYDDPLHCWANKKAQVVQVGHRKAASMITGEIRHPG